MIKKLAFLIAGFFFILLIESCSSANLYQFNYPDDPDMQKRMEKDFGDVPFWNDEY